MQTLNHVKLVTNATTLQLAMSFAQIEELLPPAIFKRIHRSFIINESKISRIQGNRVFISGKELPVGAGYRDAFLKDLGFGK